MLVVSLVLIQKKSKEWFSFFSPDLFLSPTKVGVHPSSLLSFRVRSFFRLCERVFGRATPATAGSGSRKVWGKERYWIPAYAGKKYKKIFPPIFFLFPIFFFFPPRRRGSLNSRIQSPFFKNSESVLR